ncbi:hypothetical protein AVEN_171237-1, partial [Araneus ventricosus]
SYELITIHAERRRLPFSIAAITCADVPSSVAIFGLPDLLTSATEPALLNFMISFATSDYEDLIKSQNTTVQKLILPKIHLPEPEIR